MSIQRIRNRLLPKLRHEDAALQAKCDMLNRLYGCSVGRNRGNRTTVGVVFSMDRAIQLHALLESYFICVRNPAPLKVIYRCTSLEHEDAYNELILKFSEKSLEFIKQERREDFRWLVIQSLSHSNASRVFFLVDDIIFVENVDLEHLAEFDTRDFVPSLRLGEQLTRCYTVNQPQPLPNFEKSLILESHFLCWRWSEGALDWAYPLSVDGHIFGREEILALIENTAFDSPNTLEGHLQRHVEYFKGRWGVCYRKGRIVNIPWNKVQSDNNNLHGSIHQNDLLEQWKNGYVIDVGAFLGIRNVGCHQEYDLKLKKRDNRGG